MHLVYTSVNKTCVNKKMFTRVLFTLFIFATLIKISNLMAKKNRCAMFLYHHRGINFRDLGNFLEVSPALLYLHAAKARKLASHAMLPLAV
ncbi:MAG: hypothetical protein JWP81_506 [Ferruginibacter sp.]|nr:hypothetical protein [Ferruginibacter sp.]